MCVCEGTIVRRTGRERPRVNARLSLLTCVHYGLNAINDLQSDINPRKHNRANFYGGVFAQLGRVTDKDESLAHD